MSRMLQRNVINYSNKVTPIYRNELFSSTNIDEIPSEPLFLPEPTTVDKPNPRCVIRGAYAFLLRISSIFGLAPLRFEARREGYEVSISKGMCVYSYALVTILGVYTIFGVVAEISDGMDHSVRMTSRLTQAVITSDVLVKVLIAGAGVYGAPARMRNMLEYMNSIIVVDRQLGGQYSVTSERNQSLLLSIIILLFIAFQIDDLCLYVKRATKTIGTAWPFIINNAGFYVLGVTVIVLQIQFAFTAMFVHSRFLMFNEALNVTASHICNPAETHENSRMNINAMSMGPVKNKRAYHTQSLFSRTVDGHRLLVTPCEAVVRLSRVRSILYDVVRHINNSYGLPMAITLISVLLSLITKPYFAIAAMKEFKERPHYNGIQYVWCAVHLMRMFGLVEPCQYTITECNKTLNIVCRLIMSVPAGGILQSKLELFSRQLMLQNISYSPLGMCTLGRPLVVSILGAVTTYLVILVQFQNYETDTQLQNNSTTTT